MNDYRSLRAKIEDGLEKQPDGCWVWTGTIAADGYGKVTWMGASLPVHRAYLTELGHTYPEGAVTDHLCRNRSCANPDHLEIVTHRENTLRGIGPTAINAAKTHCDHGHEFTPENTKTRDGRRYCRTCWRIRSKAYYDKRHAKGVSPSLS